MKARLNSQWTRVFGQMPPLCPGGFFERRRGRWMLRRADEVRRLASGRWRLTRRWMREKYNPDLYLKAL